MNLYDLELHLDLGVVATIELSFQPQTLEGGYKTKIK